jgi:hypothetical protein
VRQLIDERCKGHCSHCACRGVYYEDLPTKIETTMKYSNLMVEQTILIATVKTALEQSQFLNGHFKFQQKKAFKTWQQIGFRLIISIERDPALAHTLNVITEDVENEIHELRNGFDQAFEKSALQAISAHIALHSFMLDKLLSFNQSQLFLNWQTLSLSFLKDVQPSFEIYLKIKEATEKVRVELEEICKINQDAE